MIRGSPPRRVFVALPLPELVSTALARIRPSAREGVRPIDPTDMHLTLHFLGRQDVGPVIRVLDDVRFPAFALRLGSPGRFSPQGRKTVLWVGIEPSAELVGLHRATGQALTVLGFEPETRPYRPHVTVARLAPGAPGALADEFATRSISPELAGFECSRFALYESETRPDGARYRVLQSFPLDAGG